PQHCAATQTKAGMSQRAPQCVAHEEPAAQRSAVVRTMRTHREEFIAAASDDHIFVTDLSLGHRAIRNLSDRNSVAEISFCPAIHIRDLSCRRLYPDHTSSSKIQIWKRPHGVVTLKVK